MSKTVANLTKILTSLRGYESHLRKLGAIQDAEFLHANRALIETYFEHSVPPPTGSQQHI